MTPDPHTDPPTDRHDDPGGLPAPGLGVEPGPAAAAANADAIAALGRR